MQRPRFLFVFSLLTACAGTPPPAPETGQVPAPAPADSNVKPSKQASVDARPSPPEPADAFVRVGRYTTLTAKPTEAQEDLLRVMVRVTLPREIETVEQAIRHLLRFSGYQLATPDSQGPEVMQMLRQSLPQVHRRLGPMPLDAALRALMGPAFSLAHDPVHRLIAYELRPAYAPARPLAQPARPRAPDSAPAKVAQSDGGKIDE